MELGNVPPSLFPYLCSDVKIVVFRNLTSFSPAVESVTLKQWLMMIINDVAPSALFVLLSYYASSYSGMPYLPQTAQEYLSGHFIHPARRGRKAGIRHWR